MKPWTLKMDIPEWGKKAGDEIKQVFPNSVMSVSAEPVQKQLTEKALQLVASADSWGCCDNVIYWCRREGMEADDLSHIQQAVDARKNEIFDKPY